MNAIPLFLDLFVTKKIGRQLFKKSLKDTKRLIRCLKSKDRQFNGQKKKEKKIINGRDKNIIQKNKDRVIRTPLKTEGELRCSGTVNSSCSTSGTCRVNLVTNSVISHATISRDLLTSRPLAPTHVCVSVNVCKQTTPEIPEVTCTRRL
jgi:hypothetical protein